MKYLLDTNIISEVVKPAPSSNVIAWLQDHEHDVATCSVCIEEIYFGLAIMPEGQRRDKLRLHTDAMVKDLAGRTFAFDAFSGYVCANLHAQAYKAGFTIAIQDAMIAAIAKAHNLVVATRNTKDFEALDVATFNPFEYQAPPQER